MSDAVEKSYIEAAKYLSGNTPEAALVKTGVTESELGNYIVEVNGTLFVFNNNLYITDAENISRIVSASGKNAVLADGTVISGAVEADDITAPGGRGVAGY